MKRPDYTLPLDQLPDPLPIAVLEQPFDVTITPPGSKSITNRAYVLAALADGESKIIRPLRSDDTDALLDALCTLGAQARWDGEDVYITGVNGRFPRGGSINLGDGGTPTRFMIACACLAAEPVVIDGSPRMRERPIAEGVDMLRQLGATIEYVEEEGRLPVRVIPSDNFKGGELTVGKTASSQFISAVLLIAPWLKQGMKFVYTATPTSFSYIQLTIACFSSWDVDIANEPDQKFGRIEIGPKPPSGTRFDVEPDASSAAFWVCAAAITSSRSTIATLPFMSQQPDVYVAKRLQPEVWQWNTGDQWTSPVRYPVSDATRLHGLKTDASLYPDGAVALSVALACADEPSTITGLHTLRVKETDRLTALANELRKVGCDVETTDDSITITPMAIAHVTERAATVREREHAEHHDDQPLPHGRGSLPTDPVIIETYNDHRMAMAFAILGLVRPGISIRNPACVSKSYPTFWQDFANLYR